MLRITTIIGFIACAMLWQTAAAVAGVCDRFDELITTTPAPPQSALLWKLYAQELANARQVNYDLVLLGDSLAHGWPDNRLSPLQVANFGVGGDRTQHVLWRLAAPELTKLQPRKILIIIGTNNLSAGNLPCAIISGIGTVVKNIRKIWPAVQVGFLEIPPRGPGFLYKNDWRMEINAAIRLISDIKTINVDDAITCKWHSPCANYNDDNVHFSENGYRVLSDAVRATLFQN